LTVPAAFCITIKSLVLFAGKTPSKLMKKVLKFTAISLAILLLIAFLIPVLFKSKILTLVKTEINKNIEAKVDFKDLSLSLFRHFPKLSVTLKDVSVTGLNDFKGDTLLSAPAIDASVNIMSLLKAKDIKVYGLFLQSPRIHALVNKEGKANWEITKADTSTDTSTGDSSPFQMHLEKYAISDGYIYYNDESIGMNAEIGGLDHEGKGNITDDIFTLSTSTKALTANFTYANIPYLVNAATGIDADIEINNKTSRYAFKNADIVVNELKLVTNGFIQLDNDSTYTMDISFDAPSNEFKNILSLVPAVYKTEFDKLKTSGTAALKGFVKGIYSPSQLPAYKIDMAIKDGFFQYPDLPQPVKNIQLAAQFANADGLMDHTVIDITQAHLEFGNEPFDFRLLFKNPETARYIDANIKGKLNLADVSKYIKLDGTTKLAGLLWADAFAKGNLSVIEQQKGPFSAGGFLDIQNFYYSSKEVPQPIKNGNFKIQFQNNGGIADATSVNVSAGHFEIGGDPIDFTLQLSKPVTSVDFSGTTKGKFTLDNVKQFVTLEKGTELKGALDADVSFSGSKYAIDKKEYKRINTKGVVNLKNVQYISKEYPSGIQVSTAQLNFSPQQLALNNFNGHFQKSNFSANGSINNVIGYALHDEQLGGTINVSADKINLNDWLGTDTVTTSTSTASSAPFLVPANLNIKVNAKADAVAYDKVTYNNVRGSLLLNDETVKLQNVQTEALDGSMQFDGSYSTKLNKTKPDININYTVKDVDVQKAFFAYNTIQKLMPVGKFLAGKLSSQFNMTGNLNEDMFPDLSSLTGKGNVLLIKGVLKKFQPLEKLSTVLDVSALKDISLKDIKSHFEFANGKVLIKPFNLNVKDIDMQVGGMHGIDQTIDYIIAMKLPRKYLGNSGNALINNLSAAAASKGMPVTVSDMINLKVKMSGSITNPVIKTDLKDAATDITKELKQQATDFVQQKIDSTKQTLKDSLTVVKKQVLNDAKAEISKQIFGTKDSTSKNNSLDSSKKKATETLKNTFGNLLKKKKAPAANADSTAK
jgi:hypothetical protein